MSTAIDALFAGFTQEEKILLVMNAKVILKSSVEDDLEAEPADAEVSLLVKIEHYEENLDRRYMKLWEELSI